MEKNKKKARLPKYASDNWLTLAVDRTDYDARADLSWLYQTPQGTLATDGFRFHLDRSRTGDEAYISTKHSRPTWREKHRAHDYYVTREKKWQHDTDAIWFTVDPQDFYQAVKCADVFHFSFRDGTRHKETPIYLQFRHNSLLVRGINSEKGECLTTLTIDYHRPMSDLMCCGSLFLLDALRGFTHHKEIKVGVFENEMILDWEERFAVVMQMEIQKPPKFTLEP